MLGYAVGKFGVTRNKKHRSQADPENREDRRTQTSEHMANRALIPQFEHDELNLLPRTGMDESLWSSLTSNIRAALFPKNCLP